MENEIAFGAYLSQVWIDHKMLVLIKDELRRSYVGTLVTPGCAVRVRMDKEIKPFVFELAADSVEAQTYRNLAKCALDLCTLHVSPMYASQSIEFQGSDANTSIKILSSLAALQADDVTVSVASSSNFDAPHVAKIVMNVLRGKYMEYLASLP